jgi:hypothetical protein
MHVVIYKVSRRYRSYPKRCADAIQRDRVGREHKTELCLTAGKSWGRSALICFILPCRILDAISDKFPVKRRTENTWAGWREEKRRGQQQVQSFEGEPCRHVGRKRLVFSGCSERKNCLCWHREEGMEQSCSTELDIYNSKLGGKKTIPWSMAPNLTLGNLNRK